MIGRAQARGRVREIIAYQGTLEDGALEVLLKKKMVFCVN